MASTEYIISCLVLFSGFKNRSLSRSGQNHPWNLEIATLMMTVYPWMSAKVGLSQAKAGSRVVNEGSVLSFVIEDWFLTERRVAAVIRIAVEQEQDSTRNVEIRELGAV